MSSLEEELCPICDVPFAPADLCATDIDLGTCHAACLEGSPVVDLETGEPTEGEAATYRFDGLPQPSAAPCYCGGDHASGHAVDCPAPTPESEDCRDVH